MSRPQDTNFDFLKYFPDSTFNIRKSHKLSSGKAVYVRSYEPKTSQGVENTPIPRAFRDNAIKTRHFRKFLPKRSNNHMFSIIEISYLCSKVTTNGYCLIFPKFDAC